MVKSTKKQIISPYYELELTKHMSTKTVDLLLSERLAASRIINDFKGSITQLSTLLDDTKKIAITESEWEAANLVKTPILDKDGEPTGSDQWNWNDEGSEKAIELDTDTVKYITDEIKKKSDANEITISDVALIALNKKLLS